MPRAAPRTRTAVPAASPRPLRRWPFPPTRATPNSTSRCTAASASPGSTTRTCTCAGRCVTTALLGGDAPGRRRLRPHRCRCRPGSNSLDLPPEAEELRTRIRADAAEIAALDRQAQRDKLIATGYVMPHWPKPWGRAADAVEQLVIEEEFRAAGIKRPDYGITGWVILTLIQHGTPWQIEQIRREGAAQGRDLVPAVLRTRRRLGRGVHQDPGHPGRRRLEDQRPEGVDQRGALLRARSGHRAHRPGGAQACRHHHGDRRHERPRGRGATAAADHRRLGLQRGVLQRPVRARRGRGRRTQHRLDGGPRDAGQRAGQHRRQRVRSTRGWQPSVWSQLVGEHADRLAGSRDPGRQLTWRTSTRCGC